MFTPVILTPPILTFMAPSATPPPAPQGLFHLPLPALVLHADRPVTSVPRLGAEAAHGLLLVAAEHLQQPVVLPAQPGLQVGGRLDQPVDHQGGDPPVGLQVGLAVRRQAHQAGLQGPDPRGGGSGGAHVARRLARFGRPCRRCRRHPPKRVRQLLEGGVDAHFRTGVERLVAGGAAAGLGAAGPRRLEAGPAEVVTAGRGDRVGEHLAAHGALELLLWEHGAPGGGHGLRGGRETGKQEVRCLREEVNNFHQET